MRKFIIVSCLIIVVSFSCNSQSHQLNVGDKAPMFSLQDQDGKTFNMKDSVGHSIIVIFFYPKDESPVCTKEACTFRDSMDLFKSAGAVVVGINQGSIKSHKKFQENSHLLYELLSDPDKTVIKQFGVNGGLMTERVTFVVDLSGQIVFKCESTLSGSKHVGEALEFVRKLKKSKP